MAGFKFQTLEPTDFKKINVQ